MAILPKYSMSVIGEKQAISSIQEMAKRIAYLSEMKIIAMPDDYTYEVTYIQGGSNRATAYAAIEWEEEGRILNDFFSEQYGNSNDRQITDLIICDLVTNLNGTYSGGVWDNGSETRLHDLDALWTDPENQVQGSALERLMITFNLLKFEPNL